MLFFHTYWIPIRAWGIRYSPIMVTLALICLFVIPCTAQQSGYPYEPSGERPYGLPHPDAPKQLHDFAPLIGQCSCKSVSRIDQSTWGDTVEMTWKFSYIMNGMAIQDETLKQDGKHSGSIRQYIPDSARWYVHYYSSAAPSTRLPVWKGNKKTGGDIILYRDQKAPNGMDGKYKITFSNISGSGFHWLGEWVTPDESFSYPTWKIFCKKIRFPPHQEAKKQILKNIEAFSAAYRNGQPDRIAQMYTLDAKIFPPGPDIIAGRAAIQQAWTLSDEVRVLDHQVHPKDIYFWGDYAYDYGYYEGAIQKGEDEKIPFKGKYVIIWKRVADDWKIYLDIWNKIK